MSDSNSSGHDHPASWPAFSFAFQPIVDCSRGIVFAHEALIRGPGGESAASVLGGIPPEQLQEFDAAAGTQALRAAVALHFPAILNLNFSPRTLAMRGNPMRALLELAQGLGIGPARLCVEITEQQTIDDRTAFEKCVSEMREMGVKIAIDDFGAGHSGLNLLANFQPDIVKLDMELIRRIERHGARQAIVRAIIQASGDLGIQVTAEGIESASELDWLLEEGIELFQGYYIARPGFESLPPISELALPAREPPVRLFAV
jgi:EAL domain-containing protein (putative c-di-GMP-specific phosphodiesterase class I)